MGIEKIYLINLTAYPDIGGVENSLDKLANEYKGLGYEVEVIALTQESIPSVFEYNNYIIRKLPCRISKWPHVRFKLQANVIREYFNRITIAEGDLVISRSLILSAGLMKSNAAKNLVTILATTVWFDCSAQYFGPRKKSLFEIIKLFFIFISHFIPANRIEKELLEKSKVLVFSKHMMTYLKSKYGLNSRVVCHPPGVDTSIFKPVVMSDEVKKITRNEKYILGVGRLSVAKNFDLLVKVVPYLPDNINLVLVGSGPELNALESLADDLGIKERVIFAGRHKEALAEFYSGASVFVLPTKIESFGQVYLEALACGTPIVGFGGNKIFDTATCEIVTPPKNGIIASEFTEKSLARAVIDVLHTDYSKDDIALEAGNRYSWLKLAKRVISFRGDIE